MARHPDGYAGVAGFLICVGRDVIESLNLRRHPSDKRECWSTVGRSIRGPVLSHVFVCVLDIASVG